MLNGEVYEVGLMAPVQLILLPPATPAYRTLPAIPPVAIRILRTTASQEPHIGVLILAELENGAAISLYIGTITIRDAPDNPAFFYFRYRYPAGN
jgi:hypothetical protein